MLAGGRAGARVAEAERLLLALLHGPVRVRTGLLLGGAAEDLRLLLSLRFRDLATRRDALERAARSGRALAPRLALWSTWPALRRSARAGAVERASADAWALRLLDAAGEPAVAGGRPGDGPRAAGWLTLARMADDEAGDERSLIQAVDGTSSRSRASSSTTSCCARGATSRSSSPTCC